VALLPEELPRHHQALHLGAEMMMPPTDMGTVQIAIFRDPAGNVAGLVKDDPSQR
jgi:predicted enzyme related to lactoylglutathione lyase